MDLGRSDARSANDVLRLGTAVYPKFKHPTFMVVAHEFFRHSKGRSWSKGCYFAGGKEAASRFREQKIDEIDEALTDHRGRFNQLPNRRPSMTLILASLADVSAVQSKSISVTRRSPSWRPSWMKMSTTS